MCTNGFQRALENNLHVRGYVSTVITCPYDGEMDPRRVRDVTKALIQMGCYEVSLGDTVGTGTPASMQRMLNEVVKDTKVELLAVSIAACSRASRTDVTLGLGACMLECDLLYMLG